MAAHCQHTWLRSSVGLLKYFCKFFKDLSLKASHSPILTEVWKTFINKINFVAKHLKL